MSEWSKQKTEFLKIAIANGISHPGQIAEAFPLGYNVPQAKIEKWLTRLLANPSEFSTQRRYINRFMVGADPEFIFQAIRSDEDAQTYLSRQPAKDLGLKQGPAFGADNNGRLAEIRPAPSRSVIEVCASILDTFRWMAILAPETLKYQWACGAWQFEDGLGGHVHFGRKRPHRDAEIAGLDDLQAMTLALGMFPMAEVSRRRQPDGRGNHAYGLPGDFRHQRHGYEYRTWPSWLDSPSFAFLIMTLSKLVVHEPGLLRFQRNVKSQNIAQQIKNFLAYYKNLDDDARLALCVLQRGIPRHIGGDFRGRWGIGLLGLDPELVKPSYVPLSIRASKDGIAQVFAHLLTGKPLAFQTPTPTWTPSSIPSGYKMCIDIVETVGRKGLGEIICDLCFSNEYPMKITQDDFGPRALVVTTDLRQVLTPGHELKKYIEFAKLPSSAISISPWWCEGGRSSIVKQCLTSGLFPIWRVKDVRPDSYKQWRANIWKEQPAHKFKSQVLFNVGREFQRS